MFTGMLGNATVSDLARAEHWYAQLIGRGPDRRPMPGLLVWQLGSGFGLQVYCEPERAGHSTVVLEVVDLDAHAARLAEAGIEHPGIQPGGGGDILQLQDPDGNWIVLASAKAGPES